MSNKAILASIMFFVSHTVFAMECDPKALIFDLVARSYLSDHDGICCVARINKTYYEKVLAQAKQKEKMLSAFPAKSIPLETLAHPYGSAYCCVYRRLSKSKPLVLSFRRLCTDGSLHKEGRYFTNFISPLPYNPPLFFNQGKLCFYGFGEISAPFPNEFIFTNTSIKCIIRYGLDGSHLQCRLGLQNTVYGESMHYFLDYPFLIKAILNSRIITQKKNWILTGEVAEEYLEFSLDGVTLPDNYAEQTPFPFLDRVCAVDSFDKLPGYIKQAIVKRYEEQPKICVLSTR